MDYNMWKSVLLDWVNSTGFLVQNYENLCDTHIETFFIAFKLQIKSTTIKSASVIHFVKDYYKDFNLKLDDKDLIPVNEYVYVYSLFLHFACVLHADSAIQHICKNMLPKNQEIIEKFLEYLFKVGKCERSIVQSAIEEAENCDIPISDVSPITRNLRSVLGLNSSPQTPKSKMLNTWNLENRNLKAQLETERFERGYLEMQLNQCEKKLSKLDEDYRESMTENNLLKKQIQSLDEADHIAQSTEINVTVKQLHREIKEKEDELFQLTINCNAARDEIEIFKEKLQYAESQVKSLNTKLMDSFSEAETFKRQLDEREKMIDYINNNNKELSDMLKELQSNSNKQDFDTSATYSMLNSTAHDLNSSSFCVMEENLASAVVDIRLLDQQKQNMALQSEILALTDQNKSILLNIQLKEADLEKVNSSKLALENSLKEYMDRLEKVEIESTERRNEFDAVVQQKEELNNTVIQYTKDIASLQDSLNVLQTEHKALIDSSKLLQSENDQYASKTAELTEELARIQNESKLIQAKFEEMKATSAEDIKKIASLEKEKISLETQIASLDSVNAKNSEILADCEQKSVLIDDLTSTKSSLEENLKLVQKQLDEMKTAFETAQGDLVTVNTEKDSLAAKVSELSTSVSKMTQRIAENEKQMAKDKEQLDEKQREMVEQLSSHQAEKDSLLEKLKKMECESTERCKEFDMIVQQKNELNTKVDQYSNDMEKLQESLTALQTEHNVLVDESKLLQTAKEQLQSKTNELSEEVASLQKEKLSIQENLEKMQSSSAEGITNIECLQQEKKALEEKVASLESINKRTLADYDEKSSMIEENLKSIQSKLEDTVKAYEISQSDLEAVNAEKNSVITKLFQLTDNHSTLEKEYETLQSEVERLRGASIDFGNDYEAIVQQKEELSNKVNEYSKDIEILRESLSTLQAEHKVLVDASQQLQTDKEQFENKTSQLSEELTLLRAEKESIQATVEVTQTNSAEEIKKNETLAHEKMALQDKIVSLESEKARILGEKKSLVEELTLSLKSAQNQLNDTKTAFETAQSNLATVNTEKYSLAQKVSELNCAVDELTQKLASDSAQFDEKQKEVTEKLLSVQTEKESLQTQLAKLEEASIEHRKEFEAIVQQKEELASKVEEYSNNIEKLQESLTALQTEHKVLVDESKLLQTEKEQLESKTTELSEEVASIQKEKESVLENLEKMQSSSVEDVEKNESLLQEMKALGVKINSLESVNAENLRILDEKSSLNEQLTAAATVLENKIELVQSELDSARKQLEGESSKHREHFDAVVHEKNELSTKVDQYSKEIEHLQESLKALQTEHKVLVDDSKLLQTEKEQLESKTTELSEEVASIQKEKESVLENLEKMQSSSVEDVEKNEMLLQEKKALEDRINSLESVNAENLRILDEKSSLIEQLIASATAFENKIELAQSELDSARKQLEDESLKNRENFDAVVQEKNELSTKVDQYSKDIEKLQESLTALQAEHNALVDESKLLQTEKEQLKTELSEEVTSVQKEKLSIQENLEKLQASSKDMIQKNDSLQLEKKSLEARLVELESVNTKNVSILNDYEDKSSQIDELIVAKSTLEENLNIAQNQLEEAKKSFENAQSELATVNTEKNSFVTKVIKLNRTIDELTQQMAKDKEQFDERQKEVTDKLSAIQNEKISLQGQLESESSAHRKELDAIVQQKEELTSKINQYTKDIEHMQESLGALQNENKVLIEASSNKEQLLTLNEQLGRLEKTHSERMDVWKKEKESLIQDVKICRAKLMKEREAAEQKEKEYKAMRNGFEEKLEKMKEKMKTLYKEEMAKVQDKHEKQLNEVMVENRKCADRINFLDERNKEFSSQVHALNEEKLMLLKEFEIMKSKLRTLEIGSTLNGGNSNNAASKFFEMRGGNFRMEDEEGELFDNTYLDELKRGDSRRESLTFEEIQRRNSMVPPHLRSSYMPQFADNETKSIDNFKSLDDSMFSTQSENRRGTAYKRPGPPTPSKNGGRLSLGVGEILREQNGSERPSLGNVKGPKKHTPGKLSRIFSTSKLKDEDKENDEHTAGRNTLNQLQKLFFSTSTPRRRNARRSSLPKFDTMNTFGSINDSVSTIGSRDTKRISSLRNIFHFTKPVSQKILWSADKKPLNTDSTPECDKPHGDTTKAATSRKSFIKKRASLLKKKHSQKHTQKEKRMDAYNKIRRMSKVDRAVDETYSIGRLTVNSLKSNLTGATYDLDSDQHSDTAYDSDILIFQHEVNNHQGPIDIVTDNTDDEVDFEKLCNVKQSECPFDRQTKDTTFMYDDKFSTKTIGERDSYSNTNPSANLSPQSLFSTFSDNSTRLSSHCARTCWNQHKIPKLTTFKVEEKNFNANESQISNRSRNSTHSTLVTTVKSFHSNVSVGWNELPPFVQYYIIAITICLIAVLNFQFSR